MGSEELDAMDQKDGPPSVTPAIPVLITHGFCQVNPEKDATRVFGRYRDFLDREVWLG